MNLYIVSTIILIGHWLIIFEISLLVYDRDFTGRLRSLQNTYLQDSDWLDLDVWRCRPGRSRFMANTCRLVGPLP